MRARPARPGLSLSGRARLISSSRTPSACCARDPLTAPPPAALRAQVINCSLVSDSGVVDPRWKEMMKFQIERARKYFQDAEDGISGLEQSARWPVWSALIVYSKILDAIERNDYDNFNKRAFVTKKEKLTLLPVAFAKANF